MTNHENYRPTSAFIVYSHDNEDHKQWVLELSNDLSSEGIDVILDEFIPIGSNLQSFMESCTDYDKTIIICTPEYVTKANEGKGGVGYEKAIITNEIIKDINQDKYIPIVRKRSESLDPVPKFLRHLKYTDMSNDNEYGVKFEQLVKSILGIDIEETLDRKEYAIKRNILRSILNSKADSTINPNEDKTIELLDKLLQELDNTRAYGHLQFSYLSASLEESEKEELRFIIDQLEGMRFIRVIRSKSLNTYNYPIEIRRIEPIFEKDIIFISIIKKRLKPVLRDSLDSGIVKAEKIFGNLDLSDLPDTDKERFRKLILFALKDFELSGSIKLYIDQALIGAVPGSLENCSIQKI